MRWMKHLTKSRTDDKLALLIDQFGAEGYGVYWIILEKVAQNMGKGDKTSAEYSLRNWAMSCNMYKPKFKKIVDFCSEIKLFKTIYHNFTLTIDVIHLKHFRDEYSKRKVNVEQNKGLIENMSGQTTDTLLTNIESTSVVTPDTIQKQKQKQIQNNNNTIDNSIQGDSNVLKIFKYVWEKHGIMAGHLTNRIASVIVEKSKSVGGLEHMIRLAQKYSQDNEYLSNSPEQFFYFGDYYKYLDANKGIKSDPKNTDEYKQFKEEWESADPDLRRDPNYWKNKYKSVFSSTK